MHRIDRRLCFVALNFLTLAIGCTDLSSKDGRKADASAELQVAKAEAEALKAELEKARAAAEAKKEPSPCTITGELFATTQSGDVKKGAGLTLLFIRPTPDFLGTIESMLAEAAVLSEKYDKFHAELKEKYPKEYSDPNYNRESEKYLKETHYPVRLPLNIRAQRLLSTSSSYTTTANSDGKFRVEVKPDRYILVTDYMTTGQDSLAFVKLIDAQGAQIELSLDQKSGLVASAMDITNPARSFDTIRRITELVAP